MHVSAASPGDWPPGNPRGIHGLGRGFATKICPEDSRGIDGFTLKGAVWVIRARLQETKAAKCTFFSGAGQKTPEIFVHASSNEK